MNRDLEERLSVNVSRALDSFGFSYDSIKARQSYWKGSERIWEDIETECIRAGSKAEGVTRLLESDVDEMVSYHELVCSDNVDNVDKDRYKAVFQLITDNVAPGYARLKHTDFRKVSKESRRDAVLELVLKWSVEHEDAEYYLNSNSVHPEGYDRAGPAGNFTRDNYIMELQVSFNVDTVLAIPCKSESLIQDWVNRPRPQGWPPQDVIQQISNTEGHAVPVGFKGSETQHLEWRVCFTKAELLVVKEFNETQLHLFVLMKWIGKRLLKPVCENVTSYIIKNIIFWMSEYLPQDRFTSRNVMCLVMHATKLLHGTISQKLLPNYMIPARNLFAGKLQQQEQQDACQLLSSLIRQGPAFIVQRPELDDLRQRVLLVYREPELGRQMQINSEKIENFILMVQTISKRKPCEVPESHWTPEMLQMIDYYCSSLEVSPEELQTIVGHMMEPILKTIRTNIFKKL